MKNKFWSPLESMNLIILYIISKILSKDVSSFSKKKSKSCKNYGLFEGDVIGGHM